jgi:hypothetical protein
MTAAIGSPSPKIPPSCRLGVVTRHQVGNVRQTSVAGVRPAYGIAVSDIARAITRRWISEVPSKIV